MTATAETRLERGQGPLAPPSDGNPARMDTFRVTSFAFLVFALLYLTSIEAAEKALDLHFRSQVERAIQVSPTSGTLVSQIHDRVAQRVQGSPWAVYGGARVNVTVLGADGRTPLYVGGSLVVPPPPERHLDVEMREALDLLPALSDVFVSVPHGSALSAGVFLLYAALWLSGVFVYTRRVARIERARLESAVAARDGAADRARQIEAELSQVRERLQEAEPMGRQQSDEIRQLERERTELRHRLRSLGERERSLRSSASRARELEDERQALEDLLEEALEDVEQKTAAISDLEDRLASAEPKRAGPGRGRSKGGERVARRLRTLYKNLEVDERAVADLVGLGDESLRLRAEEGLKRLDEDSDTAAVRRKVGGLPPQLSIYELGFAGKGRIYYSRSERGGYRVHAIGGKASQKQDLEYLSRMSG